MANIVCKYYFLFQVEKKKKKCYRKSCQRDCFGPCTTDRAAPGQLTIPINKFLGLESKNRHVFSLQTVYCNLSNLHTIDSSVIMNGSFQIRFQLDFPFNKSSFMLFKSSIAINFLSNLTALTFC